MILGNVSLAPIYPYPRAAVAARTGNDGSRCLNMTEIVLRVRLTSGDQLDVRYEHDTHDANETIQHVVETLAEDSGVLRTSHGERLMVIYGRGVAAVEVAPRGAVL
jgi:hypothetical protein